MRYQPGIPARAAAVPQTRPVALGFVALLLALPSATGCSFDSAPLAARDGAPAIMVGSGGAQAPIPGGTTPIPSGSAGPTGLAPGITGVLPPPKEIFDGDVPCAVDIIARAQCQNCHQATPVGGAPMPLVTLTDFRREYAVRTTSALFGQTMRVYELSRIRINAERGTLRMPSDGVLAAADLDVLNDWLVAGAPAGEACSAMPGGGSPDAGAAGAAGGDPTMGTTRPGVAVITPDTPDQCVDDPTQFEPLTARDGETCYEFAAHGVSSPTDQSKFTVQPGQSYNEFYYGIPWPKGTLATRFGARFDNLQVLHHWLGFSAQVMTAPGTVETNVWGTTIGETAELVGGWAVGGCNVEFPPEMGLKLPDAGRIMIQWHHYNSVGIPQQDGSAVQWCTVPAGMRPNVGGLTFLGTENFNGLWGMPPGKVSDFSGTCENRTREPITIVGFYPHMHLLGTHMKSLVERANGDEEAVFDHAFVFDHQVNYMLDPGYVLEPGDKITSTCTFNNTTTMNVAFGQSTMQEMCYQFTFSYPYGALNNGVASLIGATNTCW